MTDHAELTSIAETPRAHGLRFWRVMSGRDEIRRYAADLWHALIETEKELAYTNGVANQFAEEAEEWRRYAMALLDLARAHACPVDLDDYEYGVGSLAFHYQSCTECGTRWLNKKEPEEHKDGCLLVPALWSDKLAKYLITPLPDYDND